MPRRHPLHRAVWAKEASACVIIRFRSFELLTQRAHCFSIELACSSAAQRYQRRGPASRRRQRTAKRHYAQRATGRLRQPLPQAPCRNRPRSRAESLMNIGGTHPGPATAPPGTPLGPPGIPPPGTPRDPRDPGGPIWNPRGSHMGPPETPRDPPSRSERCFIAAAGQWCRAQTGC